MCAACAVDLQHGCDDGGRWFCIPCHESASPHDCVPMVQIRWDSGEVTTVSTGRAA
jgi:hypothetical protein